MFEHYHRKSNRELLMELHQMLDKILQGEVSIMASQADLDAALDAFGGEVTQLGTDINALIAAVQQTPQAADLSAEVARLQAFQQALAGSDAQVTAATPQQSPPPATPPTP